MLEIKNFTKIYPSGKVGAKNINISVENGDIFAFIGHNGAGKTTTLKAIAGILNFEQGEIKIDGIDVKKNPMEAKRILAYLPDNPDLYEYLTGIEYLNFIANIFKMSENDRKQKIEQYAKRIGIFDALQSQISSYSHGMKQKLALVSALIHSPRLLLLDEPFVGLDPISSHEMKLIMQEMAQNGATIFYSTHVLDVAEKICNQVAIIKQGKLVVFGKMEEVKGMQSLENVFLELENDKHD